MPSTPSVAPAGSTPRLTGSRSSRRACSTWRRPLPATWPTMLSTATPPTTDAARIRKPRRGRRWLEAALQQRRGQQPQDHDPGDQPDHDRQRRRRCRGWAGGAPRRGRSRPARRTPGRARAGGRCTQVAAYAQMPRRTTAVPPRSSGLSRLPTTWIRKCGDRAGRQVAHRGGDRLDGTGLGAQRGGRRPGSGRRRTRRRRRPASASTARDGPDRGGAGAARAVVGAGGASLVPSVADSGASSVLLTSALTPPSSLIRSTREPPTGHDRGRGASHRYRHGRPSPRTRAFVAGGRTGLARRGARSRGPLRRRRGAARDLRRPALGGVPGRPGQQLRYVGAAVGRAARATTCSPRRCAGCARRAGRSPTWPAS